MIKKEKTCKNCCKAPPHSWRTICLKCINSIAKEKQKAIKTKNIDKMKAKRESINIRLTWVDESDRNEIRQKVKETIWPYLGKKQITIKLSHWKVKSELKKLEEKADNLWSKAVKINYWSCCQHCWTIENLNSHHIFTRSRNSTKWDIENGICLCSKHHTFSQDFSAHKTPAKFKEWFVWVKWENHYNELEKKSRSYCKVTTEYIQEQIKILEEFISDNQ